MMADDDGDGWIMMADDNAYTFRACNIKQRFGIIKYRERERERELYSLMVSCNCSAVQACVT